METHFKIKINASGQMLDTILSEFGSYREYAPIRMSGDDIVYQHLLVDEIYGYLDKKYLMASNEEKQLHFKDGDGNSHQWDVTEFDACREETVVEYLFPDLKKVYHYRELYEYKLAPLDENLYNYSFFKCDDYYFECYFIFKGSSVDLHDYLRVISSFCRDVEFEVYGLGNTFVTYHVICNGKPIEHSSPERFSEEYFKFYKEILE